MMRQENSSKILQNGWRQRSQKAQDRYWISDEFRSAMNGSVNTLGVRACRPMTKSPAMASWAVLLLFFPSFSEAFFDPPWIKPTRPVANETVYVNIRGGECDTIISRAGYPQITRDGNAIRILFYSTHEDRCIYGVGQATFSFGAFPAGSYSLQVDRTYDGLDSPVVETIGVVPFGVGGPPRSIPATSLFGVTFLVVAIGAMACVRGRPSRRNYDRFERDQA